MPYRVQLEKFEGPLDLLLFLIKKNEVEIYDIPIAEITQQYLAYLQILEFLDLENAGEFILMAATLIRIKAKLLLPRNEADEEEADDPRQELVQRLLEYQSFKEVAGHLDDLEDSSSNFYPRQNYAFEIEDTPQEEEPGREVSMFDLMAAFVEILKRAPTIAQHTVERIPVTIEEQSAFILDYLATRENVLFTELMSQIKERIVLIVTFVAILELVKSKRLQLNQNQPFSEIWLKKV
jgi:segregation and condensation protein A